MITADTKPTTPQDSAIAIIKQEHRSLGYVVHTLQRLVRDVAACKANADFEVIAVMLYYIDTFPDRCHHPKEDEHLFRRLRDEFSRLKLRIVNRLPRKFKRHVEAG